MTLGFIGLGILGAPMAGHLLAAGHSLIVHSCSQVPAALLQAGATACANADEVAAQADTITLMLPDTPDVQRVLFRDRGTVEGLGQGAAGKRVVHMSSISPIETKDFAKRLAAQGMG